MWAGLCGGAHSLSRWHPAHAGPSDSEVASCGAAVDSSAPLSWPACPTPLLGLGVLLRDINTSKEQDPKAPMKSQHYSDLSICYQSSTQTTAQKKWS